MSDKFTLTKSDICKFYIMDKDKHSEYVECYYKEMYKEYINEICR